MKKEKISQAIGDIHTRFVQEAAEYKEYGQNGWGKWGAVVASFVAVFICLSIFVVGFGTNGFFDKPEQQTPTMGTSSFRPTNTMKPTTTPEWKQEFLTQELLFMLQQGLFKDWTVIKYEEQSGITDDYTTLVFQLEQEGSAAERVKVVGIFSHDYPLLREVVYIHPEGGFLFSDKDMPVIETDVNFDRKPDVLILKEYDDYAIYTCYLGTDDGLVYCSAFEKISDPVINREKQIIQSVLTDGTIFTTGVVYQFVSGKLIETENLIWKEKQDEDYTLYNEWTLEKLVDGEMVVVETFSDKGMTDAEKAELLETLKTFDSYHALSLEPTIPSTGIYYDYMLREKQQGEFSTYEVESYVEEMGTKYYYATLLLDPKTADLNPIKMVGVFDEGKMLNILYVESDGALGNDEPIKEADVNFDGETDILVSRGVFGTMNYRKYTCYFGGQGGLTLEYCPSFDEILNPEVDTEKKFIRSWSRDTGSTHSGCIYEFIDGAFIKTEELTSSAKWDEDGKEISYWTIEKYIDGQMVVVETFLETGLTEEKRKELYEKLKTYESYHSFFPS